LQKKNILTVPGSGFGCPGHFRISYCVDDDTIVNSMKGFKEVLRETEPAIHLYSPHRGGR
jgi:aspartate aminotransferase